MTDEGLLVIWPPAYRSWARQHGLLAAAAEPLTIVNPTDGATYLLDRRRR